MDIDTIIQLINGVGFPIFTSIALGTYVVWTKKRKDDMACAIKKESQETFNVMLQAINNNTTVLQQLVDSIKKEAK